MALTKEEIKAKQAEYREQNREAHNKKNKKYYEDNKDVIKAKQKEYREKNKNALKQKRDENKKELAAKNKEIYQQNRAELIAKQKQRRAKARELKPKTERKCREPNEYVEYCIFRRFDTYGVSLNVKNKHVYIGCYKSLLIAQVARNDALKTHEIVPRTNVKGFEYLDDELKQMAFEKAEAKKLPRKRVYKPKPIRADKGKRIDTYISMDIERKANKKTTPIKNKTAPSPPTIEFKKPAEVAPLDVATGQRDGVYFLNNAWRVFRTKENKQRQFVASSSEEAKAIYERGYQFKLK